MYSLSGITVLRVIAPVIAGLLITSGTGASTIATTQQELVAMHGSGWSSTAPLNAGEPGVEQERLQQIALLVSANGNDISRSLLTRFPPTSAPSSRPELAMGLQLPEPGPLSAIIATLALAGFVMVRRFV